MSEERPAAQFIVAALARIEASMATKGDLETAVATAVAGLASKGDLEIAVAGLASKGDLETAVAGLASKGDLETAVATAVAGLATKADLAGVAKNVEIAALGRQLREMRDELRVTSAMVLRLDHMWPDIIEQLRAMVQQQLGILDRLRALEQEPPP